MPVFITAKGDASRPVCDGGVARREAYLKKYNLSPTDAIDLRDVLEEYGVNDCLFLLGVPEKGCADQARAALMEYGAWLAQGTLNATYELCVEPQMQQVITHCLSKRLNGIEQPGLVAQAHAKAVEWRDSMTMPEHKTLVDVLACLTLPEKPMHDYIAKADAKLAEWAAMAGCADHLAQDRRRILAELLQ